VRYNGAVILGKTDTVEFASGGRKALTRNPHNLAHTPGGSSSGSGAAVGDCMVHLAFGTQTGGSHIRPAGFNGIYGFKPTWSAVTREGAKLLSPMCDTVGWYGRSVADLQLVAKAFRLFDESRSKPVAVDGLRIAVCKTPYVDRAEPAGHEALSLAAKRLQGAGAKVRDLDLPAPFGSIFEAQETIMHAEGAAAFLPELLMHGQRLHADLRAMAENERAITPRMLVEAYDLAAGCRKSFDGLFDDIDAVLTFSTPGEAPEGLHTTGDWIFNAIWTVLHVPCLAIPCTKGSKGLPVGVQVIGPRCGDDQLLRIAEAVAGVVDVENVGKPRV
jgi:Asp-tRNA(Asn)/Glu-tRNA(Gln) amidotransferase A subunit family amidase